MKLQINNYNNNSTKTFILNFASPGLYFIIALSQLNILPFNARVYVKHVLLCNSLIRARPLGDSSSSVKGLICAEREINLTLK